MYYPPSQKEINCNFRWITPSALIHEVNQQGVNISEVLCA